MVIALSNFGKRVFEIIGKIFNIAAVKMVIDL